MNKEQKATNTLDAIKLELGIELEEVAVEVTLASMKLEDGVTVLEAEAFEAGQSVNIKTEDDQLIALPEGKYILEDGMELVVVEEGLIDSIGEKVEEEAVVEEEVAASDKPTVKAIPKKIIEAVTKESHFSAQDLEAIAKVIDEKFEDFKTELSKVEEIEEVAETIVHNPEKVNMSSAPKDGLLNFLNNRK